jgi:hypothetical protein
MTYYLLWSSQGEYSDRSEWAAAVYDNEAVAQADVLRASALWREITGGRGWVAYDDHERVKASPQWAELKRIVGDEIGLYDDLSVYCYAIEMRTASAGEGGTATDSEAGVAEGEHAAPEGGDAQ